MVYPMPIRPWRAAPDRKETTISISSGLSCLRRSASSSILLSRLEVAATRNDVSTTLANSVATRSVSHGLVVPSTSLADGLGSPADPKKVADEPVYRIGVKARDDQSQGTREQDYTGEKNRHRAQGLSNAQ